MQGSEDALARVAKILVGAFGAVVLVLASGLAAALHAWHVPRWQIGLIFALGAILGLLWLRACDRSRRP